MRKINYTNFLSLVKLIEYDAILCNQFNFHFVN